MNISRIGVYLPHKRKINWHSPHSYLDLRRKVKISWVFFGSFIRKAYIFYTRLFARKVIFWKKQSRLCIADKNTYNTNILKIQWKRINTSYP